MRKNLSNKKELLDSIEGFKTSLDEVYDLIEKEDGKSEELVLFIVYL